MESGAIDTGHAKALLGLTGIQQDQAAEKVARDHCQCERPKTWSAVCCQARKINREQKQLQTRTHIQALQRRLMDHLGASIQIRQKSSGAGEVVIKYASLEELDGVLGRFNLPE